MAFDCHIGLNLKVIDYELHNLDNNLSHQSISFKILYYPDTQCLQRYSYMGCNSIPMFIKNVHNYFKDHDNVCLIIVFFIVVNCYNQLNLFVY